MAKQADRKKLGPRVSVVTAARNVAPFISSAVHSILEQTYTNFEYIIVDDGSTDGTLEKLANISDPRIRILPLASSVGPCSARNIAVSESEGDLIAILDADDFAHRERLARQVNFLDANQSCGALGSWAKVFGEYETVRRPPTLSNDLKASLLFGNPFVHSTMMIRREALSSTNEPYKPSELYAEDYGLWLRIGRQWELSNLPLELVMYRSHSRQLSEINSASAAVNVLKVRNGFLSSLGLIDIEAMRPSMAKLPELARGLRREGWSTPSSMYFAWLRSALLDLKNTVIDKSASNSLADLLVRLGRSVKRLRKSVPN